MTEGRRLPGEFVNEHGWHIGTDDLPECDHCGTRSGYVSPNDDGEWSCMWCSSYWADSFLVTDPKRCPGYAVYRDKPRNVFEF